MLLESIELQGYKTFAGKTRFEFAGPITCIVGPNGSGKSNIADAIRWVLGEQSFRLLRGKKTEDMIFSGSEMRAQAGMASATIFFDNTTGWLPIDFSEVSIARRAYRDGTNEYLLNGQRVRLKDISELLSSSGLSERTYTIIGQGLVDAALALRPEDRRSLFEEAAGIGLYRARREEALRRLESTHRNIERVEDILAELRPRLRSLERQADRAAQYQQVAADLKALLLDFYGYHWYKVQKDLRQALEAANIQQTMYEAVQQEQTSLEKQLERIREKIKHLRTQLGSWHRESAQLHLQWEEFTRNLAVSEERQRSLLAQQQNTGDEISRLEGQIAYYHEQRQETERSVGQLQAELQQAYQEAQKAREELRGRQSERSEAEAKSREIQEAISRLTERQRFLHARQADRQVQCSRQEEALQSARQTAEKLENTRRQLEQRLKTAAQALEQLVERRSQARRELEHHQKMRIDKESNRRDAQESRLEIRTELTRLAAELNVLEKADAALTGYGEGTRLLIEAGKEGRISGIRGALSSQLEVPKRLEPAVAAALGSYLDAVLLDKESSEHSLRENALAALERLLEGDTRGTFLPLPDLRPSPNLPAPTGKGVIGRAADLVKTAPEIRAAVEVLLGKSVIVENRQAAGLVLSAYPMVEQAVTLSGEVFHASGMVSVGQRSGSSTLSRPRQRRELADLVLSQEQKLASIEETLVSLDRELHMLSEAEQERLRTLKQLDDEAAAAGDNRSQVEAEYNQLSREVNWQQKRQEDLSIEIESLHKEDGELARGLSQLQSQLSQEQVRHGEFLEKVAAITTAEQEEQVNYWNTQAAVLEAALKDNRARLQDRLSGETRAELGREDLQRRIATLAAEIENLQSKRAGLKTHEEEIARNIEGLRTDIEPAEAALFEAEQSLNSLENTETKARQGVSLTYRQYSQAQLTLSRAQEQLERLRERMEEDLGLVSLEYDDAVSGPTPLPLDGLVESLPKLNALPEDMERLIKRQRAQVRRMGAINPEAQTEYREVKERVDFLTHQIADLHAAERDVKLVITELEGIMQHEFKETFELVASEFKEIFARLFGGGNASLVLTDPEDLTETGIDIEARLPGRRTQGLSLLSGGERSLTATALVFALLKVSPTPFCVLDEVDAMLDEANVGRFRELLRELAEKTQFIVITHNRNTVQAADVIYGVTMGRDSASQMISLKLDDVANVV